MEQNISTGPLAKVGLGGAECPQLRCYDQVQAAASKLAYKGAVIISPYILRQLRAMLFKVPWEVINCIA